MMQAWSDNAVCMMSGGASTDDVTKEEATIKQEEDSFCAPPDPRELSSLARNGALLPLHCASPSTTLLYSPSTTGHGSEFDYSDCGDEMGSSPRGSVKRYREIPASPASPERHFCSSTTSADPLVSSPEGLKEEDTPKRLCLVCGDSASGFHYGVASCEACKAFFKRTIQQGNIEYNCPAANECEINKRRRKACQACRFHKCLRVGMLKEGVRLDRVRGGRQKYRRTTDSPFSTTQLPIKKTPLEEIKLLSDLQACEPEMQFTPTSQTVFKPELCTVACLSDLYDLELVSTIGWAKQIPGFSTLGLNDQMRLLQTTWGEILTLNLAYRSMPSSSRTLRYAHDFTLDEAQARHCDAHEIFTLIMGVVERLEQVDIAKEEYLLLKALVLTNSDVRVQDNDALTKLRHNILQAIHDTVTSLRMRNPGAHIQSLLLCLPSLRAADTALRRYWITVKRDGNVGLKKLFLEMLETQVR